MQARSSPAPMWSLTAPITGTSRWYSARGMRWMPWRYSSPDEVRRRERLIEALLSLTRCRRN